MARIRTIKPEFWDSPDTAKASPWARLCYIALWNWADDYGRGTANLKELEGFIFPNDAFPVTWSGNTVHFRDVVAEVSECFGVVLYEVDGRPYYAIPSWEKHQRNERRAKDSKYPPIPARTRGNADSSGNTVHLRDKGAEIPHTSGPGTGEQGNRGTGEREQGNSASRGELTLPSETAQDLVKWWVDNCKQRPPSNVVGQIAKQVGILLNQDGVPYDVVRSALIRWQIKGLHPSTLPSVVHEIRTSGPQASRQQQETDDIFTRAAARNGVNLEVKK